MNLLENELKKLKMESIKITSLPMLPLDEVSKPRSVGRPIKQNSIGRVKFTTALDSNALNWVKHYAVDTNQSTADVINTAVLIYKEEKAKNR